MKRILIIRGQCVNKVPQMLTHHYERQSYDMSLIIKVLSCRFRKCLRPINKLTVEECSEVVLFRHYISYEGHLFFQNV